MMKYTATFMVNFKFKYLDKFWKVIEVITKYDFIRKNFKLCLRLSLRQNLNGKI